MSPWGKANSTAISEFVAEVEAEAGEEISVDGILRAEEADRILLSVVAISGIARARAQKRLRDEDLGS